jgi:hypothetical protein
MVPSLRHFDGMPRKRARVPPGFLQLATRLIAMRHWRLVAFKIGALNCRRVDNKGSDSIVVRPG